MRYSPNSTLIPTDPAELLRWAAAHIEHVDLNRIDDRHYAGSGPTRFKKCSAYGALLVAAGDGRRSSARTYDGPAIRRAENEAFRILADHVHGQTVHAPDGWRIEDWHRHIAHRWSMEDSRTQDQVITGLLEAAEVADTSSTPTP